MCAIVGGTFTVAGIIDSIVFTASSVFKKAQIGKLSWYVISCTCNWFLCPHQCHFNAMHVVCSILLLDLGYAAILLFIFYSIIPLCFILCDWLIQLITSFLYTQLILLSIRFLHVSQAEPHVEPTIPNRKGCSVKGIWRKNVWDAWLGWVAVTCHLCDCCRPATAHTVRCEWDGTSAHILETS